MKIKELTLTAMFIAVLIIQNFVLFNFPITLTYTILYFLTKKLKNKQMPFLAILVFVIVKNILFPALLPTIIADLIGLLLFVLICMINKKVISYILIPFVIVVHLLLLDLSMLFLTAEAINSIADFFKIWGFTIATSFIAYIYCPLSIILILMIDGVEFLTEYDIN